MDGEREMEDARRLLAPLAGEPTRPSTVDISRAMVVGRRRVRLRRVAGGLAVAAATALVVAGVPAALAATGGGPDQPPPAAAPTGSPLVSPGASPAVPYPPALARPAPPPPAACQVELLPVPPNAFQSLVTSADPTGRFIAGRSYSRGGHDGVAIEVVMWDGDGGPVPVDIPGADQTLTDINANGVAVGFSYPADDAEPPTGWVYQDGTVSALAGGGVWSYGGPSINDRGVVVGARPGQDANASLREQLVPLRWPTPTSEPEELSVPGPGWSVTATDVDASGTVVGYGQRVGEDPARHQLFVWLPDGTRLDLPWPALDGEPVPGEVAGGYASPTIDDGVVTVQIRQEPPIGDARFTTFRYDPRSGELTDISQASSIEVDTWNGYGWVAGGVAGELSMWTPAGGRVPLPDLGDPLTEHMFQMVATISEHGRILAGQLDDPDGNTQAVRWRCD